MGWIKNRIDAEYRKHHKHLDWSGIAEAKILLTIKDLIGCKEESKSVVQKLRENPEFLKHEKEYEDIGDEFDEQCICGHHAGIHDFSEGGECRVDIADDPEITCDCKKFRPPEQDVPCNVCGNKTGKCQHQVY